MKMLNCPFCGSDKLSIVHKNGSKKKWLRWTEMTFSVRCNVCHARGPVFSKFIYEEEEKMKAIKEAETAACEKRNTRDSFSDNSSYDVNESSSESINLSPFDTSDNAVSPIGMLFQNPKIPNMFMSFDDEEDEKE